MPPAMAMALSVLRIDPAWLPLLQQPPSKEMMVCHAPLSTASQPL